MSDGELHGDAIGAACCSNGLRAPISYRFSRGLRIVADQRTEEDVHIVRSGKMFMHTHARTHRRIAVSVLLIACALSGIAVHAETVFKCRSADGEIAFQDHGCARYQLESQIEITTPPPVALPDFGRVSAEPRAVRRYAHAPRSSSASRNVDANAKSELVSYECRAANGELFYRHGACPKQISAKSSATGASARTRGASDTQSYSVSAQALPRGEVCRQIARAGSIGRGGHERDENVSTYERNLGRDPCRRY